MIKKTPFIDNLAIYDYQAAPKELIDDCPVCNCTLAAAKPFCNVDRYGYIARFVRCAECSTVLLNPRLTPDEYAMFYRDGIYRRLSSHMTPGDHEQAAFKYSNLLVRKLGEILLNVAGGSAVDVGGGDGMNAAVMGGHFDLSFDVIDPYLKSSLQGQAINAEDWDPGDKRYDIGFCIASIDHASSPLSVLQNLYIAVNHLLIIDVIDFPSRWRKIGLAGLKIDHPTNFNEMSFEHLLHKAGFNPIKKLGISERYVYACEKAAPRNVSVHHARTRMITETKLKTEFADRAFSGVH